MANALSTKEIEDGLKLLLSTPNKPTRVTLGKECQDGLKPTLDSPVKGTTEPQSKKPQDTKTKRDKGAYQKGMKEKTKKSRASPTFEDRSVVSYGTTTAGDSNRSRHHGDSGTKSTRPDNITSSDNPKSAKKRKPKGNGSEVIDKVKGQVGSSKESASKNQPKQGKQNETNKKSSAGITDKENFVEGHGEFLISKELAAQYEEEYLFVLKKKSMKFPTAKFFCRLCDYHCFDLEHCERHKKDTRHQRLKEIKKLDLLLSNLPPPEAPHKQALDSLLEHTYDEQGLTKTDTEARRKIVENVERIIQKLDPKLCLVMYGSSESGFGLESSNVNMDFSTNVDPRTLKDAYVTLKEDTSGYVSGVQSDFSSKVPCVHFTESSLGLKCVLGINNTGSHKTSKLLAHYNRIDPRVRHLTVAFRYFAKLNRMSCQAEGTLPPYVFDLMTIFFLQHLKIPVLPVLHEIAKPVSKDPAMEDYYFHDLENLSDHWKCENSASVGELWLRMLRYYSVDFDVASHVISIRQRKLLNRQEKKWASKKLAIEDPFMRRRNVARSVSHSQVFEYIAERLRAAYKYFGIPQLTSGPLFTDQESLTIFLQLRQIEKEHTGKSPCTEVVVETSETKADKTVKSAGDAKTKSIQDTDVASNDDSISHKHCDSVDKLDKLAAEIVKKCINCGIKKYVSQISSQRSEKLTNTSEELTNTEKKIDKSEMNSDINNGGSDVHSSDFQNSIMLSDESLLDPGLECDLNSSGKRLATSSNDNCAKTVVKEDSNSISLQDLQFRFDAESLADPKGPAIMCSICQTEGHLKAVCPEENLTEPEPLLPLSKKYLKILDDVIHKVPLDFEPTASELKSREKVVYELEEAIQELYTDAKLELFGSSCNGFGFRGSDLDLCLTFTDSGSPEDVDAVEVIEKLSKLLKKHRGLYNVFPITTAKVPIVKFKHRRTQLEGDISLYNVLAIENTRMLLIYSELDPRVKIIGYTMKVFAKLCDICDASRGSLSSYAYILVVLYFLQQRKPPVIPVLQELYKSGEKPENNIDSWNAWFNDDIARIPHLWKDWGKNQESVAELWIGLLRFYVEDFNFKDLIISIRQLAPLTKFEKLWNNRTIAIEDPFDLGHNLGGGLSRKMNMFIIRTLRNARKVFGTTVHGIPNGYQAIQDYLFDPSILTDSLPPSDRNCHVCGKIGHFVKECPIRQQQKNRRDDQPTEERGRSTPERTRTTPQPIPQLMGHSASFGHTPPEYSPHTKGHHMSPQEYRRSHSQPSAGQPRMYSSPKNENQPGGYARTPPGYSQHSPVGYARTPPSGYSQGNAQAPLEALFTKAAPTGQRGNHSSPGMPLQPQLHCIPGIGMHGPVNFLQSASHNRLHDPVLHKMSQPIPIHTSEAYNSQIAQPLFLQMSPHLMPHQQVFQMPRSQAHQPHVVYPNPNVSSQNNLFQVLCQLQQSCNANNPNIPSPEEQMKIASQFMLQGVIGSPVRRGFPSGTPTSKGSPIQGGIPCVTPPGVLQSDIQTFAANPLPVYGQPVFSIAGSQQIKNSGSEPGKTDLQSSSSLQHELLDMNSYGSHTDQHDNNQYMDRLELKAANNLVSDHSSPKQDVHNLGSSENSNSSSSPNQGSRNMGYDQRRGGAQQFNSNLYGTSPQNYSPKRRERSLLNYHEPNLSPNSHTSDNGNYRYSPNSNRQYQSRHTHPR